ncbi:MAG: nucleotidyl transferase AbiEii/AbiGii toxin family protein, partial [Clostridiales bacterium]|nr:nucleotidyl transferase AbiEii/AbiGii toxin family protein [Clostridiales bacterium]
SKLLSAFGVYIFNDNSMREKDTQDIIKRLKFTFNDKIYIDNMDKSDKRWLDDEVEVVTVELLKFMRRL